MMMSRVGLIFGSGGGERCRSDLDPEQFYEAIARCALDIFGVGHNGFKSAMIVNRVLSWYKRAKAKLKRDQVRRQPAGASKPFGLVLGVHGSGCEARERIQHTTL